MKAIPPALERTMGEELRKREVSRRTQGEWMKWLRYYLDFCGKYRHPPRDEGSLQPFLGKLAAKNQGPDLQGQAGASIALFYEVVKRFPPPGSRVDGAGNAAEEWGASFRTLEGIMKVRHYSPKTLKSYRGWIRQFSGFVGAKQPARVDGDDAVRFLTYLATERQVAASTQNQAFNALLFLFRHVLEKPFELGNKVVRARRRRHVPVVLSREEFDRFVVEVDPEYRLLTFLLYGCGLRVSEALNLRIHCFNFDEGILTVHDGKGGKDRTVPLPHCLVPELSEHRERVRERYEEDLKKPLFAGTFTPRGSERKWKSRGREWIWQFFFPGKSLTLVPEEEQYRRYHLHEKDVGEALRGGAKKARLDKRVTAHTLRHAYS